MNDAIIVGGGPAGVSCAIWLKQLGFNPVLVEKSKKCGGLQWSNPYSNTWIARRLSQLHYESSGPSSRAWNPAAP